MVLALLAGGFGLPVMGIFSDEVVAELLLRNRVPLNELLLLGVAAMAAAATASADIIGVFDFRLVSNILDILRRTGSMVWRLSPDKLVVDFLAVCLPSSFASPIVGSSCRSCYAGKSL